MTASYDITSAALYAVNGNTYTLIEGDVTGIQGPPAIDESPTAISTTIETTDGGVLDNNELELNENVESAAGIAGNYAGRITIDGEVFLVLTNSSFNNTVYVVSTAPTSSYPTDFDGGDIDSGPYPVCFATGTMIATPAGECAVEDLRIGDTVLTADGQTTTVRWMGRQTIHKAFGPAERLRPVRLARDALGTDLPHTDLVVTADHALLLDGVLCNASALVNGRDIVREPLAALPERVTYWHVETEGHAVILANGVAAETFVDLVSRHAFDNFAEYRALYGETASIPELSYPRALSARQVPASIRTALGLNRAA